MDEFDEDDERNSSPDHHKHAGETKWSNSSVPVTTVSNYVANPYPAMTNHPTQQQGYHSHYQVPQGEYNPNPTGTFPQVDGTFQANLNAHPQEHMRPQQKPQVPSFPSEGSSGAYHTGDGTEEDARRAVVMLQNSTVHPSLNNSGMNEQNLASKATAETTQATPSTALQTPHNTPAETANDENNEKIKETIVTSTGLVVTTPVTKHAVAAHQFAAHHVSNVIVQLKQQELQYKYSQPAPTMPEQLVTTTATAAVEKTNSSLGSENVNTQAANHVRMSSTTTVEETTASEPHTAFGYHQSPIVDAKAKQQNVVRGMRKTDHNNSVSQGLPVSSATMDTHVVAGNANRPTETTDTATFIKNNNHTAYETTANQLNDSHNIEMTKKTSAVDFETKELTQTSTVTNVTVAATAALSVAPRFDQKKATSDVKNMSTPKRLRNNDSAFTDDMYKQSPVANMSSAFTTAMTSLYGDLPVDTEPLVHAVFYAESINSPVAAQSPRSSHQYGGPGGGVGAGGGGTFASHMIFPQFRASPARSPALSIGK